MRIETLVLNFEGGKTEKEIYQIVLGNLNEMIVGIGDNPEVLWKLMGEIKDILAGVTNRHTAAIFKRNHEELAQLSSKSHGFQVDYNESKLIESGR